MVTGVLQEQEQVDGSMVPPFKQTFPVQSKKLIILIMLFFKYINHTMPLMLLSTTSNITMMMLSNTLTIPIILFSITLTITFKIVSHIHCPCEKCSFLNFKPDRVVCMQMPKKNI